MPRVPLEPLIKLTKAQLKALAERSVVKKGVVSAEARDAFSGVAPLAERVTGTLTPKATESLGMKPFERLPIAEARQKYYSNPEMYTPGRAGPPARELRPSIPGEEAEVGAGLAFENVRTVGVDTPKARAEHLMTTPYAEIQTNEAHAERIWAMMGGRRTMFGKMWERLRASSRQNSTIDTADGYFKSSFIRWMDDPKKFSKAYPRESKLLRETWKEYSSDMSEGGVKAWNNPSQRRLRPSVETKMQVEPQQEGRLHLDPTTKTTRLRKASRE